MVKFKATLMRISRDASVRAQYFLLPHEIIGGTSEAAIEGVLEVMLWINYSHYSIVNGLPQIAEHYSSTVRPDSSIFAKDR